MKKTDKHKHRHDVHKSKERVKKKSHYVYCVSLRGTKFLPRRHEYIKADSLRRNKFGDLILTDNNEVVGTYTRTHVISAVREKWITEPKKRKKGGKRNSVKAITESENITVKIPE